MRTSELERLKELLAMTRTIVRALDSKCYQRPPFLDISIREAKISAKRLESFLDEAVWLVENPL